MAVYYCSRQCQRSHWPAHKRSCGSNGNGGVQTRYRSTRTRYRSANIEATDTIDHLSEDEIWTDNEKILLLDVILEYKQSEGINWELHTW